MKFPKLPKLPPMPSMPKWSALHLRMPVRKPKSPARRLQASARRAAAAAPPVDEYDQEPTTKLSSAFIVVLVLHVVAVGGIYAFNSLKAHRKAQESGTTKQEAVTGPKVANENREVTTVSNRTSTLPIVTTSTGPVSPVSGGRIHQVKSGDTLTKLAAFYNVTLDDLEKANTLKHGAILQPRQTLNIPSGKAVSKVLPTRTEVAKVEAAKRLEVAKMETAKKPEVVKPAAVLKSYTVKKGDNPVGIARELKVSYDELLKLNGITDPKKLQPGKVLKVPAK